MLSYRLQCLISKNFGSGESRILVSVGLLAVVGIMPVLSLYELRLPFDSISSGGFNRRTSSRSSCLIRAPRMPNHPEGRCGCSEDFCDDTATPAKERPYSSREVTPTIVSQRRSLSSRPNSEAREYIIDEIGSEYDAPPE